MEEIEKIQIGKRTIIIINIGRVHGSDLIDTFSKIMKLLEPKLIKLFDEYKMPELIYAQFGKTKYNLAGGYNYDLNDQLKNAVVIDIFPDETLTNDKIMDMQIIHYIIDTFVHETIHHRITDEKETKKRTQKFINTIAQDIIDFFLNQQ